MKEKDRSCQEMGIKIMALLDGELSPEESENVRAHLADCQKCSEEYASFKKLKAVTGELKMKKLPEYYWDDYWSHVYNRIERGISWIFISLGAIIVLGFSAWQAFYKLIADQQINPLLKGGILILLIGLVILIVSVIREKLMIRKIDKYREVER
jgi:hypothetical protein